MSQSLHSKPRYCSHSGKQYNALLKVRGSLIIWVDKGMPWFSAVNGKRGRSPQFPDAAIPFCLTIKNLFGAVLR